MKRMESLQGLSRDHHLDLSYASRLIRWTAAEAPPDVLVPQTQARWAALQSHFEFEETALLPLMRADRRLREMAGRVCEDHADLAAAFHDFLARLGVSPTVVTWDAELRDLMRTVAHMLRTHIRYEEQVLFPALQLALSEQAAAGISDAWQRRQSEPQGAASLCATGA